MIITSDLAMDVLANVKLKKAGHVMTLCIQLIVPSYVGMEFELGENSVMTGTLLTTMAAQIAFLTMDSNA